MNYNQALSEAKLGRKKVSREIWNGKGKFIFHIGREDRMMICDTHKKLKEEPQITPYKPEGDAHARDWYVID